MNDRNLSLTLDGSRVTSDVISDVTSSDRILARVGQVTRSLLDSMSGLGLDAHVERAAQVIPDARDRLNYVASMTEQAAERVLTAIEVTRPIQQELQQGAAELEQRWNTWSDAPADHADVRHLMDDTRAFLGRVPDATAATRQQLLEILMAQDFQDLTGQVIKKISDIVFQIEHQLLSVLVEHITPERREQFAAHAAALASAGSPDALLNGPQINPEGKSDVMQGQEDVDDLLASLGF